MDSRLVEYSALSPLQRQQLTGIELLDEQRLFSGDIHGALHALPSCASPDIKGFALLLEEKPQGFFLLKRGALLPPWADQHAVTLHGLMIDRRHQGKGLGTTCLRALPALVQGLWPDVQQLMLSVDPQNRQAYGLYLALGWRDCGQALRARVGFERRLVMDL